MRKDRKIVLNPGYQLRNDVHRIALFSKAMVDHNSSKNWNSFIHPVQAIMLGFFTHDRTLGENIQRLAGYFHRDADYMERMISSYICNPHPVYTVWKGQKIYFPKNMLLGVEDLDNTYVYPKLHTDEFVCRKIDLSSTRFYSGPLLLTIMLTNRCMTHCKYCYADTSTTAQQLLPTSRILELIQEAAQMQVQQINLIGGEVFLHKDWDLILSELVRYDIAPEYISTKIPFTSQRIARLKHTGYKNLIQISLDAVDSNVLQDVLHVNQAYSHDILKGIKLLDQSGIAFQVSSVLTTYNCDRNVLTGLFRFLSTLENLRDWRIVPVSNSIYTNYSEFSRIKPSKDAIDSVFHYMEEFILPHSKFPIILGKDVVNSRFYAVKGGNSHFIGAACSALNTHMFILPDGKATICEQLYWNPRFIIGDVSHDSLIAVWNSPRALRLSQLAKEDIQDKSQCKHCAVFEQCFNARNRCWSDIIKAYGDDCWDFPDPRCSLAPAMKNNLGY